MGWFFFTREWPNIPMPEIRKRARILVVDDDEFPYLQLFQRDGYVIDKWSDVKRLEDLEDRSFDLILLDLQGVGQNESADQGFGLLRHIRETSPDQIVVAYSSAEWGLQYQEFFRLADAVLPKAADYIVFKEKVDALLQDRFSLGFYLGRISDPLRKYGIDRGGIEAVAREAILKNRPRRLEKYLQRYGVEAADIDRALTVCNAAIGVIQIWNA